MQIRTATTEDVAEAYKLYDDARSGLRKTDGPDVFDPYYDDRAYAGVYKLVERAASRALQRLSAET